MARSSDTEAAGAVLARYVELLDRQKEGRTADAVLENFVALFSDSPLGAAAARLLVAGTEQGPARNELVNSLFERYPRSPITDALRDDHIFALLGRGQYEQALGMVDDKRRLARVKSRRQAAEVCLALAGKVCAARPIPATRSASPGGRRSRCRQSPRARRTCLFGSRSR